MLFRSEAISTGKISAGEKLPSERDFAKMLEVSRPTIRAAMKILTGMGLITIRHGSGIYVAVADDPERTTRQVATSLLLQKRPLWDLFEIRETLETEAAGWAARRATPREIDEIRRLYAEYEDREKLDRLDGEKANRYDGKLHWLIAVAARNEVLVHIMNHLEILLRDSRNISISAPGRISQSVREMGRIVRALEESDMKAARREMLTHLRNGRKALSKKQWD